VPANGDKMTLHLRDQGGRTHIVELTARAAPSDPNDFQIGADEAATIAGPNGIVAALNRVLDAKAAEVLSAEATSITTTRPTLKWYKGDDAATPDRDTAKLQIDATLTVGTGARANEPAIRNFLAQMGALVDARFTNAPAERERYQNMGDKLRINLSPPAGQPRMSEIVTDFSFAMTAMNGAKERHKLSENMLQGMLDKVEQASTEETAAAMLNLQTRLQASYQTTSMLSRLSLVNYL
jgi:hypothetical protein